MKSVRRAFGFASLTLALVLHVATKAAILTSGDLSSSYDGADPWHTSYLTVGVNDPGSISINGGSVVDNVHDGIIGNELGASTSSITVDGYGSTLYSGSLAIGKYGTGRLDITNGGYVGYYSTAYLGQQSNGVGYVNVSGGAGAIYSSTWSVGGIAVGFWGSGTLNITGGGHVISNGGGIGQSPGSNGSATVSGEGSSWLLQNNSNLNVGGFGTGSLTITDGGSVTCYTSSIAGASGTATVGGGNGTSTWSITKALILGDSEVGPLNKGLGILNLNSGGLVSAGSLDGAVYADVPSSINLDGGTLSITATDSAATTMKLKAGGGTLNVPTANTTFTITSGMSGAGGLNKTGPATLALSGLNTYSGTTTVTAGTLKLSGSGSIASSPTISIGGGAKLDVSAVTSGLNYDGTHFALGNGQTLKGTGTVVGAVTIGAGSILAPGNSIGILNAATVSIASGGTLAIELGGTGYDRLNVTGAFTFGGSLDVKTVGGFEPSLGDSFDFINWGTATGTFSSISLPAIAPGLMWNDLRLYTDGVMSVTLSGDFNANGAVDAADYVLLRKIGGTQQQFEMWRANFGATASASSGSNTSGTIAEPSSALLVLLGSLSIFTLRSIR